MGAPDADRGGAFRSGQIFRKQRSQHTAQRGGGKSRTKATIGRGVVIQNKSWMIESEKQITRGRGDGIVIFLLVVQRLGHPKFLQAILGHESFQNPPLAIEVGQCLGRELLLVAR